VVTAKPAIRGRFKTGHAFIALHKPQLNIHFGISSVAACCCSFRTQRKISLPPAALPRGRIPAPIPWMPRVLHFSDKGFMGASRPSCTTRQRMDSTLNYLSPVEFESHCCDPNWPCKFRTFMIQLLGCFLRNIDDVGGGGEKFPPRLAGCKKIVAIHFGVLVIAHHEIASQNSRNCRRAFRKWSWLLVHVRRLEANGGKIQVWWLILEVVLPKQRPALEPM